MASISAAVRPEGDIIGAQLGQTHGLVPVRAASHSNICAFAEKATGARIEIDVGGDMDAVGAEALGQGDIGVDEAGQARRLHEIDQAIGMNLFRWLSIRIKQYAGRRGVRHGLRELSFELRGQGRRHL